ncbi:hypothetical protein D9611_001195 [Ephemerocybe angulata]|uniref:Nephrocystin 3-like N-terminal domain-containing protein n=1 Tax=Ephemerocybe angulata TaxID=980116 RepID=A0A8H5FLZ1_9AGAR|nr:hypothetical protein D9611_001195 [Tulosesus angulatus]
MDPPRKRDRAKRWFKEHFTLSRSRSRSRSHSPAPSHPSLSSVHTLQTTVRPTATPGGAQELQADVTSTIVPSPESGLVAQPQPILGSTAAFPLPVIDTTTVIPNPLEAQKTGEGTSASGAEQRSLQSDGPAVPPAPVQRETGSTLQTSGGVEYAIEHPVQDRSSTVNPSPDPPQTTISADPQTAGDSTEKSLDALYKPQTLRNKVYEGVKTALRTVVTVTDAFPQLKSTAAALLVICDTIDRYTENPKEFKKLLLRVELLAKTIESCPSPALSQSLESRFKKMSSDLEIIKRRLEERSAEDRWKMSGIVLSEQDKQEISGLTSQITHLIEETMFEVTVKNGSWTLQIVSEIDWMKGQLNTIEDKIDQHTAVMNHVKESLDVQRLLEKLGNVKGAEFSHRSQGLGCIPGSRVALIEQLLLWARDCKSPHLFWLSGLAGTGKTAVAKTLCSQLHEEGHLGGSYFCSLRAADRREVSLIIPTLAKILAKAHPGFCHALQAVIDQSDDDPIDMDLSTQYAKLILEPSHGVFSNGECVVFCVDALDECHGHEAIKEFISAILSKAPASHLKFFLTSRPEYSVRQSFESSTRHGSLRLHEIEGHIVHADIALYLETQFKSVKVLHDHYKTTWPPPQIEAIANFCGNMFIVASTAFKYITAPNGSCLKRFQDFVQGTSDLKREEIDALYERILAEAFKGLEDEEAKLVQSSLSLLLTAQRPLSVHDYAKLLSVEIWQVRDAFKFLHSVVQIPDEADDDAAISIFHASFSDYVTSTRPRVERWAVVVSIAHSAAAAACFSIMDSQLCIGISGVQTSYKSNDDQPKPLSISTDLAYACTAWGEHVIQAGVGNWQSKLREFLSGTSVLHWMEALSVVKNVRYAYNILWRLSKEPGLSEIGTMLSDIGDFAHNFQTPISCSAPHLYLSALPFHAAMRKGSQHSFPIPMSVPKVHHQPHGGREILNIRLKEIVRSVAISPDSKYLVSGVSNEVCVFNVQTGQPALDPFTGHTGGVRSLAFSPDGSRIVSGSDDCTIRVWDAETGQLTLDPFVGHTSNVMSVAFSPDGSCVVSGSSDRTIRVWDAGTGQLALDPFTGHIGGVRSLAFSPDGSRLVSGSDDHTIRVWDAETGQLALDPITEHTEAILSVAFSPDGSRLVSGSDDRTICVWDAETGQLALDPITGHTEGVLSVAFSPDGSRIVSGSIDHTIRVWDAETGQLTLDPFVGHTSIVMSVAFSPDGSCVVSGSSDCTIRVWDAGTGQLALDPFAGHTSMVFSVAFSPDGSRIVSGSRDSTIRVWDADTGQLSLDPFTEHTSNVMSVAFSPDGSRIVSGSSDHTIRVWDAETGQLALDPFMGHTGGVISVAFSPNGSLIVSGSHDCTVRVWDAETGQLALDPITGHTEGVPSVAFSPDGSRIVSGSIDHTIRVWDAETGQLTLDPFVGHTSIVMSVAFSPDGSCVVSGSSDRTIRVWDAGTGQLALDPFTGHTSIVFSVAFSPDGSRIVSGSYDHIIRVWDAETGQLALDPFTGHTKGVRSVAFSPDGSRIVSGSDDHTIRVCKVPLPPLQEFLATRGVSTFLHDYPVGSIALDNSGWFQNSKGDHLMWIPPLFGEHVYSPGCQYIIGNVATTKIELTNAVHHGEHWLMCQGSPTEDQSTVSVSTGRSHCNTVA